MSIVYCADGTEATVVATNMQAIAIDPTLWAAYIQSGSQGRAVFQQCAIEEHEWSLDTVLAYAHFVDRPEPAVMPAPAPRRAAPPAPGRGPAIRARGQGEDTDASKFCAWMVEHSQLVVANPSLGYLCGAARELKGSAWKVRTVAVSVSFTRNGAAVPGRGLSFVFHYHPGVSGPGVGSAEGSKWHFKPYDGAKTWVRLPEHQFAKLDAALVKSVKDIARGKK